MDQVEIRHDGSHRKDTCFWTTALAALSFSINHCSEPNMTRWTQRLCVGFILLIGCAVVCGSPAAGGSAQPGDDIVIDPLAPDSRGGKAYQLAYLVRVPVDVYWNFKTDFDNDFLVNNKYIREHRFISRTGSTVVTENKYANGPDVFFRWQTTVFQEAHRLDFFLVNPQDCGQIFHYGHIQAEAVAAGTKVTQVAYFDFLGASLWAGYPWGGGMKDFLTYTARWERDMVLSLKDRYSSRSAR